MPRWTEEQQLAIDSEGKNIIVSAGAGSGKTAVLTARVLRKVKSGVNITDLLILTFTKAAAYEMKERIRKAISKEENLKAQLDMIDSAYITTFDSYALSIVKKYHYLLNISKDVSICEASVIALKKEKIIDEIFEELYKVEDEKFLKLISDFCTKDDIDIKNYIINISNKLDMKYDKKEYLKNYINNNFTDEKINKDINEYTNILLEKISIIDNELKNLDMYVDSNYYSKVCDVLNPLLDSKTYLNIKNSLDISIPSIPRGTEEEGKKAKDNISSVIKELKSLCTYPDISNIKECILSTKNYVEIICNIILKLDEKINEFKFKNDVYEFNDIAKMAIRVLKENEEIVNELKYSLNEILVDEYQDTNDLQETFISMIENNNVYMVGDIKQSIYRFRNANPYIFKNKYDNYSKDMGGMKIDLNKNFRSRRETLDNINVIFNIVMDDVIGGAEYKESHQMIFGNTTYENEGKTQQNNNFEVYNYSYEKDSGYSKEEIEAFIIANDIKNKIENKYKVFDKDELLVRDIKYSDFVILMDRTTNFGLYKKIFEYLNIPLTVYKDETINNGFDIYVIRNILKLIVKVKNNIIDEDYKYCFMSIARSFLFDLSDDEIFNYIKNGNYNDSIIIEKIKEISLVLDSINNYELLNLIINKFNFYSNIIKIGNVTDAMIRIEYLSNLSTNLSSIGYNIYDFINYIDDISKKQYDIKYSNNSITSDSVKIMTIHKSKGLEYHICYYSGLYAKFNTSDIKERFTFDNQYGIIVPYVNESISNSIYKVLLKNKYLKEEISEKIRLFYVALTRAKEKMIMITSMVSDEVYNKKSSGIINDINRLKYASFDDILKSVKNDILEYLTIINLDNIKMSKDYNIIKNSNFKDNIPNSNKVIKVNEINIENIEKEEKSFSKKSNELITSKEKENINLGKNMHYLLEILDFKNPNLDNLQISDFYKQKIKALLNNTVFDRICDAKIYKEYEFKFEDNKNVYHGIIDLMLEYDNEIIIIDYKLKNTIDENYVKQLNGYKNYIKNKTNKEVKAYLYSIIDESLESVG